MPFQKLMGEVANSLPPEMDDTLETSKGLFSRINKNDYGKGGAWDFYWGAFFPKDQKRTYAPQLYVSIDAEYLFIGFYIGDYGKEPRRNFSHNCRDYSDEIADMIIPTLENTGFIYGEGNGTRDLKNEFEYNPDLSCEAWLKNPNRYGFRALRKIPAKAVVELSESKLRTEILDSFKTLFPLVLLAEEDSPMKKLQSFLLGTTPPDPKPTLNDEYSFEDLARETHLPEELLSRWIRRLSNKKQAIIYGPPGTGKTYVSKLLTKHLLSGTDGVSKILQLHPSYAYEDFMQGLRPKALKDGGLEYELKAGRFKEFCESASHIKGPCILIIDEINRANLSRVFGELMYLLEYRNETIPLAGGEIFKIPDNVLIIGTMNTADRSIALVDHALRRRFAFFALYPNYDILVSYHTNTNFDPTGLIETLQVVNKTIGNEHFQIGVSYFLDSAIENKIEDIWRMEIEPYLEELFFDQPDKVKLFSWEKVGAKIQP